MLGYDDQVLLATKFGVETRSAKGKEGRERERERSTHFNNVAIRVECRITIQLYNHSLNHGGKLSGWIFIPMSLIWHL